MKSALRDALEKANIQFTDISDADELAEETTIEAGDKKRYHQNRHHITSLMGYLIGIEDSHFGDSQECSFQKSMYDELEKNALAKIIRNLCRVRAALELHYNEIFNEFRYNIKSLSTLPEYIPADAVKYLYDNNIRIESGKPDIIKYVVSLNQHICSRISAVKSLFPDWIKWEYVKEVFIMPGGTKPEGVEKSGIEYTKRKNLYPYQTYINWNPDEEDGNILYCDEKFVTLLYARHNVGFYDLSLVRDISKEVVDDISGFIGRAENAIIVVDCENSNPIKLAGFLYSMPDEEIKKIKKILLFDSHHTQKSWRILSRICTIPVEHFMVERLIETKSQVDMTLAAETCKAVYQQNIDSVFLVSSDSDYWALIKALHDTKFLVMVESEKCGRDIKEALDSRGIYYCYLDNFSTDLSYQIKVDAILDEINGHLEQMINFNVKEMLADAVSVTWTQMTEGEKKNIYNKYLKNLRLDIDDDGNVSCKAE